MELFLVFCHLLKYCYLFQYYFNTTSITTCIFFPCMKQDLRPIRHALRPRLRCNGDTGGHSMERPKGARGRKTRHREIKERWFALKNRGRRMPQGRASLGSSEGKKGASFERYRAIEARTPPQGGAVEAPMPLSEQARRSKVPHTEPSRRVSSCQACKKICLTLSRQENGGARHPLLPASWDLLSSTSRRQEHQSESCNQWCCSWGPPRPYSHGRSKEAERTNTGLAPTASERQSLGAGTPGPAR